MPEPPDLMISACRDADRSTVTVQDLRREVGQLRRAMETRPTIDLARGILMAAFGLSPEDAWSALVAASQNTNAKLHQVAQHLVNAVGGAPVPEAVQEELSAAVARLTDSPPAERDAASCATAGSAAGRE